MEYLTISALNKYLKYVFDNDINLQDVYLKGEISNLKFHQKGNIYLTLKDEYSSIQAIILGKNEYKDILQDGLKVLVRGSISVYVPYGSYSVVVEEIIPDGIGTLYLKLEALKLKLKNEGLFDFEKKFIPRFPKRIGVITSKTGSVIEDIKKTVQKRYPLAKIILYPANVQGVDSKFELVKRINEASTDNLDCMIIGRGGGSIEDLWAFNEEIVVRAISKLNVPVISAIGHETDNTLSDLVSDLRASTPTGAAMSATPDIKDLRIDIDNIEKRLNNAILNIIEKNEKELDSIYKIIISNSPSERLKSYLNRLDLINKNINIVISKNIDNKIYNYESLNNKLNVININNKISLLNEKIFDLDSKLNKNIKWIIEDKENKFLSDIAKLKVLNPLSVLEKGYSILTINDKVVKSVNNVKKGDVVDVTLGDGKIKAEVL